MTKCNVVPGLDPRTEGTVKEKLRKYEWSMDFS